MAATSSGLKPLLQIAALALVVAGCAVIENGIAQQGQVPVATGPDPAAVAAHAEAVALMQSGDEERAAAKFDELAARYPDHAGPLVNRALIHARRGEGEQALAVLDRAVTVCEHCAEPWNQRGVLLRQQGRFNEAEEAYLKAIAANADYAYAHFNLGVLYDLYLQRPQLALEQYERYLALETDASVTADVGKWIADLRRRTGAVERAAKAEDSP